MFSTWEGISTVDLWKNRLSGKQEEIFHFINSIFLSYNNLKSEKHIQLYDLKGINNIILFKIEFSDNLKKYFTTNQLEIEYDVPIKNVDDSILSIPALSCLIAGAWPTGADFYLEKIDEKFPLIFANYINLNQH